MVQKKQNSRIDYVKKYVDEVFVSRNMVAPYLLDNASYNFNTFLTDPSGVCTENSFVIPNILSQKNNFIIHDANGKIYNAVCDKLEADGYEVMLLDLTGLNTAKSICYNPLTYLNTDNDVFSFVDSLIAYTNTSGKTGFWDNAEKLLLTALILYLIESCPAEDRTFANLLKLLSAFRIDENDSSVKFPLDVMFDSLECDKPGSIAVKQYRKFRVGSGTTLKSVVLSVGVRLQFFELSKVQHITCRDDINLRNFSRGKKALFIVGENDDSGNTGFIIDTIQMAVFRNPSSVGSRNHRHIQLYLGDEGSRIINLYSYLTKLRKHNISVVFNIQDVKRFKDMYKNNTSSILELCDVKILYSANDEESRQIARTVFGISNDADIKKFRQKGKCMIRIDI